MVVVMLAILAILVILVMLVMVLSIRLSFLRAKCLTARRGLRPTANCQLPAASCHQSRLGRSGVCWQN